MQAFDLQFSWFSKPRLNSSKYLPLTKAAENPALSLSCLLPLLRAWVSAPVSTTLVPLGCAKREGEAGTAFLQRAYNRRGLSAVLSWSAAA